MEKKPTPRGVSRREFNRLSAGVLAGAALRVPAARTEPQEKGEPGRRSLGSQPALNILFIFTDQERYSPTWPAGLSLPAHERLQETGVTFTQHYTSAIMCTPSRSVLMTGLQTADNRMFDNCDCPWQGSLSPTVPTIGHMLRKAGYYTAYKGKWHLNKEFDSHNPTRLFTRSLSDAGKPWSLFVSLVNPHDIMYFNTDAPGEKVQDTGKLLKRARQAPNHPLYRRSWDMPVAKTLREPLDAAGRPKAHGEFLKVWDHVLGRIPPEEARWRRFNDFYINSIRSVDVQVLTILAELDALALAERTIIVFTADHGEMAGAHGLRGKGPFAYEQSIHVPFVVVHPDVRGGQTSQALSSHVDVVPTLLSLAGVSATRRSDSAGRDLPGKDLAPVLSSPRTAGVHAARDSVLFAYSALLCNDSGLIEMSGNAIAKGKDARESLKASGYQPDLKKRGSLRTVFDGRYKFSRYFAPVDRNRPATIEELYAANDVELFDLEADPDETVNLAADREKNAEVVTAMSTKLEAAIKAEIGVDNGREMPEIPKVTWYMDTADL